MILPARVKANYFWTCPNWSESGKLEAMGITPIENLNLGYSDMVIK
jgi:hypothetical protein